MPFITERLSDSIGSQAFCHCSAVVHSAQLAHTKYLVHLTFNIVDTYTLREDLIEKFE